MSALVAVAGKGGVLTRRIDVLASHVDAGHSAKTLSRAGRID
jgi:hypothetical protein